MNWFTSWFSSKSEDDLTFSHDELLSDLVSVKKQNQVQQKAYQAIQRKLEAQPGHVHPYESVIQADCLKVESQITEFYSKNLKDSIGDAQYLSVLLDAGLEVELNKSSPTSLEHELRTVIGQHQGDATRLNKELEAATQTLKVFKGANAIHRSAEYPESQSNTLFLIAAFAIGEAIANSMFLKWQNSGLMSITLALGIALINVVGNVMLGNRYRSKNHIEPSVANEGGMNFIYSVLLILGLNIAIALYRAYIVDFVLDGKFLFESLILFSFGIILGILSFREGYKMDDEYPGYGPMDRKVRDLENQLEEIRVQYSGYANQLLEASMSNLERIDQRILSTSANFQAKMPEISAHIERWSHDRALLEDAYQKLIHVFRAIYLANLQSHDGSYPSDVTALPISAQLNVAKGQVDKYLLRREKLDAEISKLRKGVLSAKKNLSDWVKSSEGQKLINWPAP